MKETNLDLENPDLWDYAKAEVHPGVKDRRAVVAVNFGAEEFDEIAAAAESEGKLVSEFVKQAAIRATKKIRKAPTPRT